MTRRLYEELGGNIRKRREELGLTQANLAEKVGLSRSSVTNVERGRQAILLHQFMDFVHALDALPGALLPKHDGRQDRVDGSKKQKLPADIQRLVDRIKPTPRLADRSKATLRRKSS